MTIQKAIHYFLTSLESMQLSSHTIKAYEQDLLQWKTFTVETELDAINFEIIQNYIYEIQSMQLKPSTLKRKRVVLHRFFKYCYDKRLCKEPLHQFIDPIKMRKTKAPKEVLTPSEINMLFEYIDTEITKYKSNLGLSNHYDYLAYTWIRNKLLIGLLLYTGCRAQEAVSLKKTDLDFPQNQLTLLAKGHKFNVIPIHPELIKLLEEYKVQLNNFSNQEILNQLSTSPFLFPSRKNNNEHLSTRTLHDLMLKCSNVLGRHIHAHIFRHTFASYCIAAHMDITTLSSLISHSNPSITLSIYTHEIEASQKQEEIKKLSFKRD